MIRRFHSRLTALFIALVVMGSGRAFAVPSLLNHQGRIAVSGVNFNGSGQFKFALVNANGSVTYWSNDGSSTAGSQPTAAVTLTVSNGLYAVLLGNTELTNMTAIAPALSLFRGPIATTAAPRSALAASPSTVPTP